jgi:hypothetical protein
MNESKLDAALALAARGFRVFPVSPNAKTPLVAGWREQATTDTERIRAWWAKTPDANVGVSTEGLVVVDVDPKNGGREDGLALPPTLTVATPSGGRHYYYAGVGRNSVSSLAPGVDTRSSGGYVVGPGSCIGGRPYRIERDLPVAKAPDYLLSASQPRPGYSLVESLRDVERAAKLVLATPVPMRGERNAAAFRLAQQLRDLGVREGTTLALLHQWNARGVEPLSSAELAAVVRNAGQYSRGAAGAKSLSPSPAIRWQDFVAKRHQAKRMLIDQWLAPGELCVLYGPPGAGKSFLALAMAWAVSTGGNWMGYKAERAPALYCAFEGGHGLAERIGALSERFGGQAELDVAILGSIEQLPDAEGYGLVVVDTLARAMAGRDENSAKDITDFLHVVTERAGEAAILLVHHSGKDVAKGARGSSALRAACDVELSVGGGFVSCEKQRDREFPPSTAFVLEPVAVGGIKSCVAAAAFQPDGLGV